MDNRQPIVRRTPIDIEDVDRARNVNCPFYDRCLADMCAVTALPRQAKIGQATWECSADCLYRGVDARPPSDGWAQVPYGHAPTEGQTGAP